MNLLSPFEARLAPLRARWQNLEPPVRRGVLTGACLAFLLLWWAYAWLPVTRARADLQLRQAGWETQLASMRALAEEARHLQQIAPIAAKEPARLLADRAVLQTLFGADAKVSAADARTFRLSASNLPYAQWLEKLDQALTRYRLKIVSIQLKVVSAPAEDRTAADVEWVMADDS